MSFRLATKKGYAFFEVSSAFQKAIRRAEEREALYWTVELFNSGFDEYLWKRIRVIVSEDVGLAEPNMPANIEALYNTYTALKKKSDENKKPHRLPLIHAVCMLCRARKSRLIDWKVISLWAQHDDHKREIPDYAYDKHNNKGRRMGRGVEHFFEEGTMLERHAPQQGEAAARKEAYEALTSTPDSLFAEDEI
jgi:replication-associated recombination protein RarA